MVYVIYKLHIQTVVHWYQGVNIQRNIAKMTRTVIQHPTKSRVSTHKTCNNAQFKIKLCAQKSD